MPSKVASEHATGINTPASYLEGMHAHEACHWLALLLAPFPESLLMSTQQDQLTEVLIRSNSCRKSANKPSI